MNRTFKFVLTLAVALALAPGAAMAMDDPAPKPTPKPSPPKPNPELAVARHAITVKDWNAAITALTTAEHREPRNADVQNLLGYSHRNLGNLDLAFAHYGRALQLEPRHLGTHEYAGEAYLMTNNVAKAEEHLAALKRYCSPNCVERDELEKQIAEYRRRTAATK